MDSVHIEVTEVTVETCRAIRFWKSDSGNHIVAPIFMIHHILPHTEKPTTSSCKGQLGSLLLLNMNISCCSQHEM